MDRRTGGTILIPHYDDDHRYTADELREMPTISRSQADDLHVDDGKVRVWLSRVGIDDGMPYDDMVTVEHLHYGRWITIETYPGGRS
jgi:hypothetical protein